MQSGDGGVSLALQARAGAGDDSGLAALYAQLTAEAGGRKISYKAIKAAEFFVVAGEDKGEKFYTRFAKSPADWPDGPILRGFAFAYPSERSSDFDKLALAVANSFDPFADTPASHGGGAHAGRFGALRPRHRARRDRRPGARGSGDRPLARLSADADPALRPNARAGGDRPGRAARDGAVRRARARR